MLSFDHAVAMAKAMGVVMTRQPVGNGQDGTALYAIGLPALGPNGVMGPFGDEDTLWFRVCVHLVLFRPGVVVLTTREFGSIARQEVLPNGLQVLVEHRSRLEVRQAGLGFDVYWLKRRYQIGQVDQDVMQQMVSQTLETIGSAADFAWQFIGSYERPETPEAQTPDQA